MIRGYEVLRLMTLWLLLGRVALFFIFLPFALVIFYDGVTTRLRITTSVASSGEGERSMLTLQSLPAFSFITELERPLKLQLLRFFRMLEPEIGEATDLLLKPRL